MPERIELPSAGGATTSKGPIRVQPNGFDLLALPGVRRFVRWRYARLVFQLPLLVLALFVIVDGLTGRQLAPRNVATTASWLHYRGLVVVALAVAGNAFCAACPLMLTRGPSRWLARALPGRLQWPRFLKNKYLVALLLLAVFLSYEVFDLWASPWLTAWLAVGYFAGALAIDSLFPAGTFCRWVCPLGNFNFVFASLSPSQVAAADHDVCRSCREKPCLHGRESHDAPERAQGRAAFVPLDEVVRPNGSGYFPGCETDLFVPTVQSNMDCTFCFNCVRACPYDNVTVRMRPPGWELARDVWRARGGLPLLILGSALLFWGLLNAAAMIGPFHSAAAWLADALATSSEAALLAVLFAGATAAAIAVPTAVAYVADRIGGARTSPWDAFVRWAYPLVALGFGFWAAHYLFHFLTGALSIVPVFEHFFAYRGLPVDPDWRLARLVPTRWLFPVTAVVVGAYAIGAAYLTLRIALRDFGRRGAVAMWPMLLLVLGLAAVQLWILAQPMEMRGTILGPSL